MEDKTARRLCQLVAAIVASDGTTHPSENEFLTRILRWFNLFWIKPEELHPLPDVKQAAEELRHMPPDLQAEAFELLVQAVAADQRYADEERRFLQTVAAIVGISPAELDTRVQRALGNAKDASRPA